jgi:hypothetical protein
MQTVGKSAFNHIRLLRTLNAQPNTMSILTGYVHPRGQHPWSHIDEADQLLDRLRKNHHNNLSVHRAKLDDSYEARVHLVTAGVEDISGFGDCKAVLVWPNSD